MKTVKLTCENGYTWKTSVSEQFTKKSLDTYFIGNMFNTGVFPVEIMSECIKCELLQSLI